MCSLPSSSLECHSMGSYQRGNAASSIVPHDMRTQVNVTKTLTPKMKQVLYNPPPQKNEILSGHRQHVFDTGLLSIHRCMKYMVQLCFFGVF